MRAPHNAALTGRSHGTPATSTTLVLATVALFAAGVHGMASADWTPLGIAAVTAWAVFLPALAYDAVRLGREDR